jgi:hypothetical protein
VEPDSNSEQSTYDKWLDQPPPARRRGKSRTVQGIIPITLWIVLFLGIVLIFVFMLFFADSGGAPWCRA